MMLFINKSVSSDKWLVDFLDTHLTFHSVISYYIRIDFHYVEIFHSLTRSICMFA